MEKDNEFNKLSGFVNSADDGFYIDFANWLVAQGEELYNSFKKNGYEVVINYIKQHNIKEKDYTFECMI